MDIIYDRYDFKFVKRYLYDEIKKIYALRYLLGINDIHSNDIRGIIL